MNRKEKALKRSKMGQKTKVKKFKMQNDFERLRIYKYKKNSLLFLDFSLLSKKLNRIKTPHY
jgi:hypothetical protein